MGAPTFVRHCDEHEVFQTDCYRCAIVRGMGRLDDVKPPVPLVLASSKTVANPSLTYSFLDLGGPEKADTIYVVNRYGISGPDPFTAVAGNAFPYIASVADTDSANEPPFSNIVDIPSTIPGRTAWTFGQLVLHYSEHLIYCVKGLPNGATIKGFMQVERWNWHDFLRARSTSD